MYSTKAFSSSSGFGQRWRSITAREACPRPRGSGSSAMTSTPRAASDRATASPVMWQLKTRARGVVLDALKSAIDVGEDVLGILDTDREPEEPVGDPKPPPLVSGQAPVGRYRRVEHPGEEGAGGRWPGGEGERVGEPAGRRPGVAPGRAGDDPAA